MRSEETISFNSNEISNGEIECLGKSNFLEKFLIYKKIFRAMELKKIIKC